MNSKRGFSLVEIMIVLSIVAIIGAVSVPKFLGYKAKARRGECLSSLPSIIKQAVQYKAKIEYSPCSIASSDSYDATCVAGNRNLEFPFKSTSISNYFYTYSIRPADVLTLTGSWYPDPSLGANKYGFTINKTSTDLNHYSMNNNYSADGFITAACLGRISPDGSATRQDELVLLDSGKMLIVTDEIKNIFNDTTKVKYP